MENQELLQAIRSLIQEEVKPIREEIKSLKEGQDQTNKRLDSMDSRLDSMDSRFDSVDSRFDNMDSRLDSMDSRLDRIESDMASERQQIELSQIVHALRHNSEEVNAQLHSLGHNLNIPTGKSATKEDVADLSAQFTVLNDRLFRQEVEVNKLKAVK